MTDNVNDDQQSQAAAQQANANNSSQSKSNALMDLGEDLQKSVVEPINDMLTKPIKNLVGSVMDGLTNGVGGEITTEGNAPKKDSSASSMSPMPNTPSMDGVMSKLSAGGADKSAASSPEVGEAVELGTKVAPLLL